MSTVLEWIEKFAETFAHSLDALNGGDEAAVRASLERRLERERKRLGHLEREVEEARGEDASDLVIQELELELEEQRHRVQGLERLRARWQEEA